MILIIAVPGACSSDEQTNMTIDNIIFRDNILIMHIKSNQVRSLWLLSFNVPRHRNDSGDVSSAVSILRVLLKLHEGAFVKGWALPVSSYYSSNSSNRDFGAPAG